MATTEGIQSDTTQHQELADRLESIFAAHENPAPKAKTPTRRLVQPPAISNDPTDFLRASSVFGALRPDQIRMVLESGKLMTVGVGGYVFESGQDCDCALVIKSGVVEIMRPDEETDQPVPVAFLGRGETLGEIGVLAGGKHRSWALAPEGAELLRIEPPGFEYLLSAIPEFAVAFATTLARRLLGTAITLDRAGARSRHLEGSLEFFDLGTLIQSLLSSDVRSGHLLFRDSADNDIGELRIIRGSLRMARFRALDGEEAFYQFFVERMKGMRFSFYETDEDIAIEEGCQDLGNLSSMTLLMEAARLRDELDRARSESLVEPDRRLRRSAAKLDWPEPVTEPIARAIWTQAKNGTTLRRLVSELPCCEARTYMVLLAMIDSKMLF
ncbi:MAG: cyclic nucleotide-binding domain-containing protein [Planctomycetes bacterium]|nr:cyclic nucleotide-binding domain-containing protein [Planctomycetota bacterium]